MLCDIPKYTILKMLLYSAILYYFNFTMLYYYMILHDIVRYFKILYGTIRSYVVLYSIMFYGTILHSPILNYVRLYQTN